MGYDVTSGQTSSGISLSNDYMYVFSGGTADTTTVNTDGSMDIEHGGTAIRTVVNESGSMAVAGVANKTVVNGGSGYWELGSMTILGGGVASSNTVNSGGIVSVEKNGLASETVVNDCGSMHVYDGGMANATTVNSGGSVYLDMNAAAGEVTVNGGGTLEIRSGGSAVAIRENGGCVNVADGANASFIANTFSGLILSNGIATLHAGTTAESAAVDGFGVLRVYADGTASSTTVNSGGNLYVSARGVANDTAVNEFGIMYIFGDGVANTAVVNSGGSAYVGKGGIMKDAIVNDCAGLYVSGSVSGTIVNGADEWDYGELYIHAGGSANTTTVNSYAWMSVDEGGAADEVTVNGRGCLFLSSGAAATAIRENGGYVDVADGANVSFVENSFSGLELSDGSATLHARTTAESVTVKTGGMLYVCDGGKANGTALTGSDRENCAEMYVYGGGRADSTTVNCGGWIYVVGTAGSTVVNSDGYLGIAGGGRHTGSLTIADGAVVSAYAGSVIDFDISTVAPGSEALVNDMARIQGTPDFTLTIGAPQSAGTYSLAGNAAGFDKTISVVNPLGMTLGTLTVGGGTKEFEGAEYTLELTDDSGLVVTVSDLINGPKEPHNNYLYDTKQAYPLNTYVTESFGMHLNSPGEEIILDRIGTVDHGEEHYHNHVGKSKSLSDDDYKFDYAKIVLDCGAKLSFHAVATAAATFTVYSLTENPNGKYTLKKLQTLKLKNKNGVFSADSSKTLLLEKSGTDGGEYYVSMQFTDKKADEAYYNVTLNGADKGTLFYVDGDDGWNNGPLLVTEDRKKVPSGKIANFRTVEITESGVQEVRFDTHVIKAAGAPDVEGEWENFVGFGDDSDYVKLAMTQPVKLNFTITATDKVKLVVYKLTKGNKWTSTVVKSKELTLNSTEKKAGLATRTLEVNLARLVGKENTGYYVSVQSTNAKSGGKAWYNVSVDSIVYASDYGLNNKLFADKKNKIINENLEQTPLNAGETMPVTMENDGVELGKEAGETICNCFVGYGDEYDYAEIVFNDAGKCTFTVDTWGTAKASSKFTVYKLTKKKNGVWTKKSLGSVTLKNTSDDPSGQYGVDSDEKTVEIKVKTDETTRYFVSMQSVDAKKGKEVYYNVTAAMPLVTNDSALSMPETDVLAAASMDARLDFASDKLLVESGSGLFASL